MTSFLEKNKDFVLKLKINKADGQTQIRRVCLPRISDGNGGISYQDLSALVVAYSVSKDGDEATEKYVSLTYYDDEKDLITIASTEELMDAIELFSGQGFMRITTCVKPKISYSATSTAATAASPSAERGTSTHVEDNLPAPPIKLVLESFAGILSSAVNQLQEGLATQVPGTRKPENDQEASSPPNLELDENTTSPSMEGTNTTKARNKIDKKEPKAMAAKADEMPDVAVSRGISASHPTVTNEEEEMEETKPFIHGRHTCDACLTTPIVGKRYHSTNLPDYDLCQNCFDNYKGSEIKFDTVQLGRDTPFQERWHGRYQRTVMMMKRRGRSGRGGCGPRGRRFRGRNHGNMHPHRRVAMGSRGRPVPVIRGHDQSPPQGHHDPPTPGPLPGTISPGFNSYSDQIEGGSNSPTNHASNNVENFDFDNALKEAIRRSLDDVAPKEAPTTNCGEVKETENHKISECSEGKSSTVSVEDINDVGTGHIPRSVEIEEHEEVEKAALGGDSVVDTSDVSDELKEIETMEKSMDIDSVDSEKLLSKTQEPEPATIPSHIDATLTEAHSEPLLPERKSLNNFKEASFASDAVGNGDIAEVMGKTLDMVAGVIGEMLSESEDLKPFENHKEAAHEIKTEELIENSNEILKEVVDDDDADWSVVKSVGTTDSVGTTESGQIAKAAELLGSALFNSDMKSSTEENGFDLTGSDSAFSIPSSVPTDLGTQYSRVVATADRWASELEKLKELGFHNESRCIEILEKIESSNEGMDSIAGEPTNIDLVVNELLELN